MDIFGNLINSVADAATHVVQGGEKPKENLPEGKKKCDLCKFWMEGTFGKRCTEGKSPGSCGGPFKASGWFF